LSLEADQALGVVFWQDGEMDAIVKDRGADADTQLPVNLLSRFDVPGPRYTSYPTADRFVEAFGEADYLQALQQRAQGATVGGRKPLSVYVHIPFCESVCYYCA
jgi:oxygen-independent coproporphyrinogen-3 oxidase